MDKSNVFLNPETKLSACPVRNVTVALPGPLNERLDRLVDLADDEGARTNRRELLGALVLQAAESGEALAAAVVAFRKARARDAAVAEDLGAVLRFERHQPGPRRKSASSE
jgi:hypothetical protein